VRVAVVGAGAVGCFYGAILARAGHSVTLVGRPQLVEAVNDKGLLLETVKGRQNINLAATTRPDAVAGADLVLMCVKSADTKEAARQIAPFLDTTSPLWSLQNGVDNVDAMELVLGRPAVPVAVYVAVELLAPGHVKHHGRGDLVVGLSPSSDEIARAFIAAGISVELSDNAIGALWTKLIINCALNALSAITGRPYGMLIGQGGVDDLVRGVIEECLALARASNVSVPADIHQTVASLGITMAGQLSSTAQDLAKGKKTEINHLNGFIVRKGRHLGIATPVNQALHTLVELLEK
jgi:2-dehydropantoate 2-reductase